VLVRAIVVDDIESLELDDRGNFAVDPVKSLSRALDSRRDWIVCQFGAREHYALAVELHRRGRLRALCTDIWADDRSIWRAISNLSPSYGRKLRERHQPLLRNAPVITMAPGRAIAKALLDRCSPAADCWARQMKADRRFARAIARRLECGGLLRRTNGRAPVVFAYSYAAREIFVEAKRSGCFTVLGQIDPGPEEAGLVREIAIRHGFADHEASIAPEAYWDNWREECRLADLVLVNSNWGAALAKRGGVPAAKLRVVPVAFRSNVVGDRMDRRRKYPERFTRDRPLELLFLGQIILRKGVVELIEGMRRLRDAPVRLAMVGRVGDRLRALADDLPFVEWLGPVARSEAAELYRRSDLFILPTHSDGFAITQIEALAHDLPVVSSRYCGDVIEDGVQGIRIEHVTAEAIENAIRFAIGHPDALAAMSAQAAARLELFSPERVVDMILEAVEAASV
jgi:glycosyltransferase involved in cell wall biosynthesis